MPEEAVEAAARALRSGKPAAILIGGPVARGAGLRAAARIAAHTGAELFHDTFAPRIERGAGVPAARQLPYLTAMATEALSGLAHLVTAGTYAPVGFFAYPDLPSRLAPDDTAIEVLAGPLEDAAAALEALADLLGAPELPDPEPLPRPDAPQGAITAETLGLAVAATLPEGAIVVDESVTAAAPILAATAAAPAHDWLTVTGGSIGFGLPAATGAAVACPDRPVLCMDGDGSAMYTIQSLWTQAREGLDVTNVIVANRSYAILEFEMSRVGAELGAAANDLFDISRPELDFVAMAASMGVPGRRVEDAGELAAALRESFAEPGPRLIEAVF